MWSLFTRDSAGTRSFTAINNLLVFDLRPVTRIGFTPILPHPATDHTATLKFPRCLTQKRTQIRPFMVR